MGQYLSEQDDISRDGEKMRKQAIEFIKRWADQHKNTDDSDDDSSKETVEPPNN